MHSPRPGLIHVLAISGLHVGLLAAGVFIVFRGLLVPGRWAAVAAAVATGLYAALVGGGTPVVRATLLVWVACLATVVTRRPATINSLAAAALVVVAWRPAEVWSAGAQLSFLSTAVLVGRGLGRPSAPGSDPIERLIERSRPPWSDRLTRPELANRRPGCRRGLAVWLGGGTAGGCAVSHRQPGGAGGQRR